MEEEEEGVERPEKLLLCGWMYKAGGNWIYEWFNFSFYEHKQPHIFELLGKIELESRDYVQKHKEWIQQERDILKANLEKEAEKAAQKA